MDSNENNIDKTETIRKLQLIKNELLQKISLYLKEIEQYRGNILVIDEHIHKLCAHQWELDTTLVDDRNYYICQKCKLYR